MVDRYKEKVIPESKLYCQKRLRRVNKERRLMWETWREEARKYARKSFPKLKEDPLFIAGIMLYWGEGDNKLENSLVRLGNTDPEMIRIFSLFLRNICNVPLAKMRGAVVLYSDLNKNMCEDIWSDVSGIPRHQFHKTHYIDGRHPTKRLTHGIGQVIVCSKEVKEKITTWINLFQKNIL